jgi:hypothetical protein
VRVTSDLRVRSKLADGLMEDRAGKCPGDVDYDVLLTGPTRLTKLDGKPLAVYLPGAMRAAVDAPGVYDVLHDLRTRQSRNRGEASGTRRIAPGHGARGSTRPISSAIIGAFDPSGQQKYCRLTSWTGQNLPSWELLHPVLQQVAANFREHVPERYAAQLQAAEATDPAWVVPRTPFTTVTVNNSYPTGTHRDKGDLDAGFSTITTLRRGEYAGGKLVFPQYRVAVDLKHGDLILMDAHEWHGNTIMTCVCGARMNGYCALCHAERISVVAYYRTKLADCGSPEEERDKADRYRERTESNRLTREKR